MVLAKVWRDAVDLRKGRGHLELWICGVLTIGHEWPLIPRLFLPLLGLMHLGQMVLKSMYCFRNNLSEVETQDGTLPLLAVPLTCSPEWDLLL